MSARPRSSSSRSRGRGASSCHRPAYLAAVREACDRVGALLILDEIQTGLGRTGKLVGVRTLRCDPDIMTTAKSLGGSLVPISATVFTEDLREFLIPNPFIHLSTFGGSDLACAVALEVLAVIEETGSGRARRGHGGAALCRPPTSSPPPIPR